MMNKLRWRVLAVAMIMLAGVAMAVVGRPSRYMADQVGMPNLETLFPKSFGDWQLDTEIVAVLPSPDVQAMLDKMYNQVLARTYVNPKGERVMLSVAYGGDQSDGTSAHRPEVCYPAQGFSITSNQTTTLAEADLRVTVRQLMAIKSDRHEPITYWVVVGEEVVTTGIGQKLAQMRYGLRGVIADGMLVRISSIDTNANHAQTIHARFIADMAISMPVAVRSRVFGKPSY